MSTKSKAAANVDNNNVKKSADCGSFSKETDRLVKEFLTMGYAECEAREALIRASNDATRAVQYLVEGSDADSDDSKRREQYRQLRHCLMGNPAVCDAAIAKLLHADAALAEVVATKEERLLELLMESSSEDEASN